MHANKQSRSGVFIDGSNLRWGSLGMRIDKRWFIDFAKFQAWLRNEYQPLFFKYYGTVDVKPRTAKFRARAQAEARLYAKMEKMGYEVITKPLKYIRQKGGTFITKGDMDIELVLGIMENLDSLDEIIIVSGDSDYLAPVQLVYGRGKSIHVLSFRKLLSWELRTFAEENDSCDYRVLESIRKHIELI